MHGENSFSLRVTAVDADVDQAELEELALQLRQDLLTSGVPSVEREVAGPAQAGTRAVDLIVSGVGFLVTGLSTAASVAQLVDFIQRWREAHPRRRRVSVSVVGGTAGPVERTRTGRRSALLVANAAYQDPGLSQLRSPAADVRALAGVLGEPGIGAFDVDTLTDADEVVLRRRVAAFFADRNPDDVLLLHFSCHGLKDQRGRLYLAAADTELNALAATGLPASFVSEQMSESASRSVLLILDCCYSGAFVRGAPVRADRTVHVADEFRGGGTGRTVLTASSATEYSFEGGQITSHEVRPSVFTEALVSGLRTGAADLDHDGDISVDELFEYASRRVRESQASQVPRKWTFDVTSALVVARSVRPAALPDHIRSDLESDRRVLRLEAVKALAGLLAGSREGYRRAAYSTLLDLRDHDDSVQVRAAAEAALSGSAPPPAPVPAPVPAPAPAPAQLPPVVVPSPAAVPAAPVTPATGDSRPEQPVPAPSPPEATQAGTARSRHRRARTVALVAIGLVVAVVATVGIAWSIEEHDADSAEPAFGAAIGYTDFHHDGDVESASLSPNGKWLVTVGEPADPAAPRSVQLWDVSTGQSTATFDTEYEVVFSPDGTIVANTVFTGRREVTTVDKTPLGLLSGGETIVELRETTTGRKLATFRGYKGSASIVFSPDSKTVATADTRASLSSFAARIRLWEVASGKLLATLSGHDNGIQSMAFSPDGQFLVSGAAGGTTKIWDVAARKSIATLRKAWFPVWISADGATLATRRGDKGFQLRNMPSGKLTATVTDAGDFTGFSTDASAYTSAHTTDTDGEIRVWDVVTRKLRTTLYGHSVVFSPDSRTIATARKDGTLVLWDAATGERLATLIGHTGTVTDIVFTPDGKTLLTTGKDKTVRRWQVRR